MTALPKNRFAILWPLALCALALAYLWGLLINQLRIAWTTNPQYAYGVAVPFLCAYLLWRRIAQPPVQGSGFDVQGSRFDRPPAPPSSSFYLLFAFVALLYAPIRLIQEANPEWSLVSWALAFEVIGLTLLMLPVVLGAYHASRLTPHDSGITHHASRFTFPICFFLVAVPWPYVIENPVIQSLTRMNTAVTIELLGWLNIPALQQGNVIEVRTGTVGIDEACSGIRSLQATLMLSLFFGEFYWLKVTRRALLVLSGFGLAFLFNVGRTTLLTAVAARDGVDAVSHWHDPAGVTILVGCFLGLWVLALLLSRGEVAAPSPPVQGSGFEVQGSKFSIPPSSLLPHRLLPVALTAWLVMVEIGVALWYRHVEAALPVQPTWQVAWPTEAAEFRSVPIPQKSKDMLRYDDAKQAQWTAANGTHWQLSWFYWQAGKAAGYLAKSHNPLVCMPAIGYSVADISPPQVADLNGLRFPFRIYSFEREGNTLYVLYSRWDDRAAEQSFATEGLTRFSRLQSVWTGRGNHGQRVIGLALWGVRDAQAAREQLLQQLQHLLVVNPLR